MSNAGDQAREELWESNKEAIQKLYLEGDQTNGKMLTYKDILERLQTRGLFATICHSKLTNYQILTSA